MDKNLEYKIVDTEKLPASKKKKMIFMIINGVLAVLVFLLCTTPKPLISSRSILEILGDDGTITMILFFSLLFISFIFLLIVYIKTPGKGKIQLTEESLYIKYGGEERNIKLDKLNKLNFFFDEQQDYWMEYEVKNIKTVFLIDIVFTKEKEELIEMINIWKENGVNVFLGPLLK